MALVSARDDALIGPEGRGEMLDEGFMKQLMLSMILAGIIVAVALAAGWVRW